MVLPLPEVMKEGKVDGWEAPEFSLDSEPELAVGLSVRRLSS